MLTLVFPSTNLTSASIPVRWCVDAETFTKLTDTGLKPFILLKVSYERGYKPSFHLFPLDQYTAYLDIHYPGKITINGHVMVVEQNQKSAIHRLFMTDSYYRERVYADTAYDGLCEYRGKTHDVRIQTYDGSPDYNFDIDENLFGKELPQWLNFYINRYWYANKPKDQCDQRRRLLLFPFTTLLVLIVDFCIRICWNTLFILGCWMLAGHPGFQNLLHPFDMGFMGKYNVTHTKFNYKILDESEWLRKHNLTDSVLVYLFVTPFIPVVYLMLYVLAVFIGYDIIAALYAAISLFWTGVLVIAAIVGIILGGRFLIYKIGGPALERLANLCLDKLNAGVDRYLNFVDKIANWLAGLSADSTEHQRELLLCHSEGGKCLPELSVRDKSVTVLFADIKNKVCKPMRG